MVVVTVSCFVVLCAFVVLAADVNFQIHSTGQHIPRHDFIQGNGSNADAKHELIFAIQQRNLAELDKFLLERSTPGNPLYQQWFSFEEVGQMTSNPDGAKAVEEWLAENNIEVSWKSAHSDYLKATAKISQWEQMLNTKFYEFEDQSRVKSSKKNRVMHRATEYSLPEHVAPHLHTVFNTVQVPPVLHRNSPSLGGRGHLRTQENIVFGQTTVDLLNEFYGMNQLLGNSSMSQSVFATDNEFFSPQDLSTFQGINGLLPHDAAAPYGHSTTDCILNSCTEGNLDMQYIMGVAQQIATTYWYVQNTSTSNPFVDWVTSVADTPLPPFVNSMSWGAIEQTVSSGVMTSFNTEALKLAARGVTVIVSTGDGGVAEIEAYCEANSGSSILSTPWTGTPWTGKGYFPSFPATSPYVTAVGATMGPETHMKEAACDAQLGGKITTGGGFSTYNPTPSWQKRTVKTYLATSVEDPGFNPNGRAYPDVSLMGYNYQFIINGQVGLVSGTSASAPVFAAMVSLVNTARVKQGKGPVGFMNPTLYVFNATNPYFNDITIGENNCLKQDEQCCQSGFQCDQGWDPVTGFGSIQYINLLNLFNGDPPVFDDHRNHGFSDAELAGIIAGSIAATIILAGAGYLLYSRRVSKEWQEM